MKIIYICSPCRGNPPHTEAKIEENLMRAAEYCEDAANAGYTPVAPHLFFRQFLNDLDPEQRARGRRMGAELLPFCSEVWVFGNEISEGMAGEVEQARRLGLPVIYKNNEIGETP